MVLEKRQILTELNKMPEGVLVSLDDAIIGRTDKPYTSTITSRYHKGVGGHQDNMILERIKRDE